MKVRRSGSVSALVSTRSSFSIFAAAFASDRGSSAVPPFLSCP
jgi:hypothetical protein